MWYNRSKGGGFRPRPARSYLLSDSALLGFGFLSVIVTVIFSTDSLRFNASVKSCKAFSISLMAVPPFPLMALLYHSYITMSSPFWKFQHFVLASQEEKQRRQKWLSKERPQPQHLGHLSQTKQKGFGGLGFYATPPSFIGFNPNRSLETVAYNG